MRRPAFDFSRCLSDEQVELLILAPDELDRQARTHLIAHLCTCGTCRQVAGLLAGFYAALYDEERRSPRSIS